jgi:hypothetical protein
MPNKAEGNPDEGNLLVITLTIRRNPEAYLVSNTERRINWFENTT